MTKLSGRIHSLDRLDHPFGIYITPYIFEENGPEDLTLIDTCLLSELPKLLSHFSDEGYEIKNVKRLILTHTHVDHVQAVNEVKRLTGAKVYSHWIEAGFLNNDPPYYGPPSHDALLKKFVELGISERQVENKFGRLTRDPIVVDHWLREGDSVGKLKVIHSPGHTLGHISLYSEEDRAVIGGDFLFKDILGSVGLFLPNWVSIDPVLGVISARRIAKLHFDKLLLGHQNEPLLEKSAPEIVEKAAARLLKKE